jgi:hypothetical protein
VLSFRGVPHGNTLRFRRRVVDPKEYHIIQLAKATEGLTSSEIENVFIETVYLVFDGGRSQLAWILPVC